MLVFTEAQAEFKSKRSSHYNEASNMQLAKQLIEQEMAELEEEEARASQGTDAAGSTSDPTKTSQEAMQQ